MTEKRFEMVITGADGSFHYLDKNTGEKITSTLELENKLNELHEENEYLCEKIKENEWHWNTIDEDKDVWMYKCKKLEEENEQLKTQLKDCEKRVTDKEVEWIRENTVWEQMPSNKRTHTSTIYHRRNDE